jgi:phosphate transport system substrate-binding protein
MRGGGRRLRFLHAGVGAALIGLVAACGAAAPSPTGTAGSTPAGAAAVNAPKEPLGTLSETGSSLLFPLAKAWAKAYHQDNPAVTVTTASTGSGAGITAATAGTADIGASDAYLSSGDVVKNNTLLNIPLAISAQTVVYNVPSVSQQTHIALDGTVLADIYQGKVTNWNDPAIASLNKGVALPDLTIVPIHRRDSSGDTFLFTSLLVHPGSRLERPRRLRHHRGLPAGGGRAAGGRQRQPHARVRPDRRLRRLQRDQLPPPGPG